MPRKRRLEFPGEIHHIMARGLDGMALFIEEIDKQQLCGYFKKYITSTECRCYAWALLDNHYHLLLRTGQYRLGETMLRIHTAYSMYFNRKYKRRGYVFQDRYKSIVTAEYHYIRWLICYIHLNPLRAGKVKSMDELDNYHWSGHKMLVTNVNTTWFFNAETLRRFGNTNKDAMASYKKLLRLIGTANYSEEPFNIMDMIEIDIPDKDKENEKSNFSLLRQKEAESFRFLQKKYTQHQERKSNLRKKGLDIDQLSSYVCRLVGIKKDDLMKRGHNDKYTEAKALLSHWGYRELGIPMTTIGDYLGLSNSVISRLAERGKKIALEKKIEFKA